MSIPAVRPTSKSSNPPFFVSIEAELGRVEDILHAELTSVVKTVSDVSRHILDAGGKRLRPSLVILSTCACQGEMDSGRLVNIAAGTELIHMATLMHDDVIDGAESRRGRMTANSFWGNQVSVLAGDYMLAKATSLFSRDGSPRIMDALSQATIAMAEGEIRQIESLGDTGALAEQCLSIIRGKTAEFMSTCCRIGAILAGASESTEESLAQYGLNLGFAFQITDDLLDLVGNPAETGKPIGGDIREGKVTLPVILALEKAESRDRMALESILRGNATPEDIDLARKLAEDTGAIEGTRVVASEYIEEAVRYLHTFPASEARDSLQELAHFILTRKR